MPVFFSSASEFGGSSGVSYKEKTVSASATQPNSAVSLVLQNLLDGHTFPLVAVLLFLWVVVLLISVLHGVISSRQKEVLFDKHLALIPLLPATHINNWGVNSFTQFWNALGDKLTRHIAQLPRCVTIEQSVFDLTTMITKNCQMSALRKLRSLAVASWNSVQDDKRSSMRPSVSNRLSSHITEAEPTSPLPSSVTLQTTLRHALPFKQTIKFRPRATAPGAPPVSDFPADFRGCLGFAVTMSSVLAPCAKSPPPLTDSMENCNIKFNRPQHSGPHQPPCCDSMSLPRPMSLLLHW